MSDEKRAFEMTIDIEASPDVVWRALRRSGSKRRYAQMTNVKTLCPPPKSSS